MRTSSRTGPKLRVRREELRALSVDDLRLAAAGTWAHQGIGQA